MERLEHAATQRVVRCCSLLQQFQRVAPGDRTKAELQAAGPVDSVLGWIVLDPEIEQLCRTQGVYIVAREAPCLRQRHHPLVTVELPGDLVVANRLDVQVRNATPVFHGSALARYRVELPVRAYAPVDTSVAEQVELAEQYAIGGGDYFSSLRGPSAIEIPGETCLTRRIRHANRPSWLHDGLPRKEAATLEQDEDVLVCAVAELGRGPTTEGAEVS